eukprot:940100-Rhodomonas_salina.3
MGMLLGARRAVLKWACCLEPGTEMGMLLQQVISETAPTSMNLNAGQDAFSTAGTSLSYPPTRLLCDVRYALSLGMNVRYSLPR